MFSEHFGHLKADVEEGKKENRSLAMWTWTFKKFLEKYQKEDIYMVHSLEKPMRGVHLSIVYLFYYLFVFQLFDLL